MRAPFEVLDLNRSVGRILEAVDAQILETLDRNIRGESKQDEKRNKIAHGWKHPCMDFLQSLRCSIPLIPCDGRCRNDPLVGDVPKHVLWVRPSVDIRITSCGKLLIALHGQSLRNRWNVFEAGCTQHAGDVPTIAITRRRTTH